MPLAERRRTTFLVLQPLHQVQCIGCEPYFVAFRLPSAVLPYVPYMTFCRYDVHMVEQYNAAGCLMVTDPCGVHECGPGCSGKMCRNNQQVGVYWQTRGTSWLVCPHATNRWVCFGQGVGERGEQLVDVMNGVCGCPPRRSARTTNRWVGVRERGEAGAWCVYMQPAGEGEGGRWESQPSRMGSGIPPETAWRVHFCVAMAPKMLRHEHTPDP